MNKTQLRNYAPQARRDFIQMVRQRADLLGLTAKEIQSPVVEGEYAMIGGRPYPRRYAELHQRLAKKIKAEGLESFIERVAYSWFNRFAALRYMEVNGFLSHPYRVLSSVEPGKTEPDILTHAAEINLPGLDKANVIDLKLAGNKDAELYRLLLIAQCNELHSAMPFLFERVNDETEILLPDNLLHSDSVVRKMVTQIDEESWKEVEIVGWLYQFYISEKKDEVIGSVVKSEDIPAATQLFTPNWIVKYMTQNSLGRLWLENHPESKLAEQMEFYIKPVAEPAGSVGSSNGQAEEATQDSSTFKPFFNPASITVLDPACGSGHILVEAYDLLKAMYTESGYSSRDIPSKILENNLFGLDIDERAAQLASFALIMKARADDARIFEKINTHSDKRLPHIVTVPDSSQLPYTPAELADILADPAFDSDVIRKIEPHQPGKLHDDFVRLLEAFNQGRTLGSLIRIPSDIYLSDIDLLTRERRDRGDLMEQTAAKAVEPIMRAARMLVRQYDCVIANPPYMGGKGMNAELKAFAAKDFPRSKSDLFAMFVEREMERIKPHGTAAFVTPFVWMFISSYEAFRTKLIQETPISSLIQLEYNAFEPACVPVCTFTIKRSGNSKLRGEFIKLSDFKGHQNQAPKTLEAINNPYCPWRYTALNDDFKKISGSPIAYWLSNFSIFDNPTLSDLAVSGGRCKTHSDETYVRFFWEIRSPYVGIYGKWRFYERGGEFRKFYGNKLYVVNWSEEARNHYSTFGGLSRPVFWGKEGISWSGLTSSITSFRLKNTDTEYSSLSPTIFFKDFKCNNYVLGLLNSSVSDYILKMLNPTLTLNVGEVLSFPVIELTERIVEIENRVSENVGIARDDWDSFETSWEFKRLDVVSYGLQKESSSVEECWQLWEALCNKRVSRMQELETKNNRLFIEAYGLEDELSPEVPLDQITLARADPGKDTRRVLSYFLGCLMGRYSLDEEGLIYADSGNVGFDPSRYKTFPADEDGIVPVTDMEWFPQEAARQFEGFLGAVWGENNLQQNLLWIAAQLGAKAGEMPIDTVRRYFSTSFFKDHLQAYKKKIDLLALLERQAESVRVSGLPAPLQRIYIAEDATRVRAPADGQARGPDRDEHAAPRDEQQHIREEQARQAVRDAEEKAARARPVRREAAPLRGPEDHTRPRRRGQIELWQVRRPARRSQDGNWDKRVI